MTSSNQPQRKGQNSNQGAEESSPISQQILPNAPKPSRPGPGPGSSLVSKDHRHRPSGIWYPPSNIYRLSEAPDLFTSPSTVPTLSTDDPRTAHRTRKAWMYCVSAGPTWELLEDRAFFKEEYSSYEASSRQGRLPRPQVYSSIDVDGDFEYLTETEASKFLPEATSISVRLGLLQDQKQHTFAPFAGIPMDRFIEGDSSFAFYAGAPVTAADWCPLTDNEITALDGNLYIAISTLSKPSHPLAIGLRIPTPSPASIQIWSYGIKVDESQEKSRVARCVIIMCMKEGCALQVRWCPLPSHHDGETPESRRLGMLAAATTDGAVGIYAVPKLLRENMGLEAPSYVLCRPRTRLSVQGTSCLELDWANSETIAVGCANGFIAVFAVKEAITRRIAPILTHLFPCHYSAVQSLCWLRVPSCNLDGQSILTADPTIICSTGTEGVVKLTDIRDCVPSELVRNREIPHAVAYSAFCGSVLATDVDFWVKMFQIQPGVFSRGHAMVDVGGAALTISVSDMHPLVAVGSADGACYTANMLRGTRREGSVPLMNHKIFQLDYSAKTGEYRMLDHFLPRESGVTEGPSDREQSKSKPDPAQTNKNRFENGPAAPSGLWPSSIAVTTVRWNSCSGLGYAPLLLSGTASGIVRIDFLEGAWIRESIPYGSIEKIRGEEEDTENESMSQSDSD